MAEKKVKSKIRKSRVSDEQLIEALEKSGGIMAAAARAVGLDRSTVHHRVNEDAKLKAVWENVREINLDAVESKLNQAIQAGELAAIFFYLKCQGKRRGWIERQEHELVDKPMPAQVVFTAYDASTMPIPQAGGDDD